MVDLISAFVVDKIGHRKYLWIAHIMACLGLCALAILPQIMVEPFIGLLISVCLYAIGGGLLEVLVSPVLEALPFDHKTSKMSLLHSFYCWGYMAVVIVSTGFFAVFGTGNWPVLTLLWALLWALFPLWNLIPLLHCPMIEPKEQSSHGLTIKQSFSNSSFWLLMVVMVCGGASELSISQWGSELLKRE